MNHRPQFSCVSPSKKVFDFLGHFHNPRGTVAKDEGMSIVACKSSRKYVRITQVLIVLTRVEYRPQGLMFKNLLSIAIRIS